MILFLIFSMFHLTIFLLYLLENVSSNLSTEFFTSAITVLIPKNSNSLMFLLYTIIFLFYGCIIFYLKIVSFFRVFFLHSIYSH